MSPDGSVKPPPEEKLLRLIRGKSGKPHPDAAAQPVVAAAAVAQAGRMRPVGRMPWTQGAVWGLGTLLAVEGLILVASAAWPVPKPVVPAVPAPADPGQGGSSAGPIAPLADIPSLANVASRPLFGASPGGSPGSAGTTGPVSPPSGSATLLSTRLTLMGIVAGDRPQAIIADSQTQKTYFVSVGQPLAEGATLEQVLDNRVIINFNGEKIELTL